MKINIENKPISRECISKETTQLKSERKIYVKRNRLTGFVILLCAIAAIVWLLPNMIGENFNVFKGVLFCFIHSLGGLGGTLLIAGQSIPKRLNIFIPQELPSIFSVCFLYFIDGDNSFDMIPFLIVSSIASFTLGAMLGYVYYLCLLDRSCICDDKLAMLKICPEADIVKIKEWIACPTIKAYVGQINNEPRDIIKGEYCAFRDCYHKWKSDRDFSEKKKAI